MFKDIKIRVIITLLVTAAALVYLVPSFTALPDQWKKYMPSDKLRLGLDLQGGMHLVSKWTPRRRWKAPWTGWPMT